MSMGHKADQNLSPSTYRPSDQSAQSEDQLQLSQGAAPPPLPPRDDPNIGLSEDAGPPPYSEIAPTYHSQPLSHSWSSQDPRSSSMQSLVPHTSTEGNGIRTLLLVYVHGFMGNETSFQSFPAHVHNLVTDKLKETHVVHTKIYPKYKSRKDIRFARDDFSDWLQPHEGLNTEVVLLGHSMGGILSAEVALLNKHRILGTVNFDTPFLGMHPGVIASGLGSLFIPASESPAPVPEGNGVEAPLEQNAQNSVSLAHFGSESGSTIRPMPTESTSITSLPMISSTSLDLPTKDPNYDPPFPNDVRLPQRTGWANALHFINKHSDGLTKATQAYVKSHLEFGGAMADYKGLKSRYASLRALEDLHAHDPARTRFVNYYTASTGRPKKPKSTPISRIQTDEIDNGAVQIEEETRRKSLEEAETQSLSSNSKISFGAPDESAVTRGDTQVTEKNSLGGDGHISDDGATSESSQDMEHVDPAPMTDEELVKARSHHGPAPIQSILSTKLSISTTDDSSPPNLPPLPPMPEEPPAFAPTSYADKDAQRLAEKDHTRRIKAFQRAVKDRDKAISDRRKFLEKKEKDARKEREKGLKAEEKEMMKVMEKGEKERAKQEIEGKKRAEKERAKEEEEKKRIERKQAKAEKEAQKKAASDTRSLSKTSSMETGGDYDGSGSERPKRDKKFCMLPPMINGRIDPCWVRIFMPGVDEVGAHCGLFFVDGLRYQRFVADVAERIESWVAESRN